MNTPDFATRNAPDPAAKPDTCPFCGSTLITTQAKTPDPDTYWRCKQCGEVWNPSRRATRR